MDNTNKFQTYSKAQSDFMGLVVIVLIFIIAISFLLFFTTRDNKSDFVSQIDKDLHTSNTIASILQTNTLCRDLTVAQVIEQCVWTNQWNGPQCNSFSGDTPCDYSRDIISIMLHESLSKQFDYEFNINTEFSNAPVIEINSSSCLEDKTTKVQPLSYNGGKLFITLSICDIQTT